MTVKTAALALLASPLLLSAAPEQPRPTFVMVEQVRMVSCPRGSGTAFRTGSATLTSVAHVTSLGGCQADGAALNVTYSDTALDFSTSRVATAHKGLRINCGGFIDGQPYLAIGYARGIPIQRAMIVIASDFWKNIVPWGDNTVLIGREKFIPGMSGGPVINRAGEVVGLVKGYHRDASISYAVPLKDTPLCS